MFTAPGQNVRALFTHVAAECPRTGAQHKHASRDSSSPTGHAGRLAHRDDALCLRPRSARAVFILLHFL